ncbi:MAG: hypothetical protein ACKV2V_13695 [Blastocatellia bacterium]
MHDDDPEDELEAEFYQRMDAFEKGEAPTLFDELRKMGIDLPPPENISDSQMSDKLFELAETLASLGAYIENTNHLSDRQLYTQLWSDTLREQAMFIPGDKNSAWHMDMIGSGSEEHTMLFLKYYASEEYRRDWAERWPEDPMPEREIPPYDRDQYLPTRESRWEEKIM